MSSCMHWISLFSTSSWFKTIASGLCYELGVNGEKKLMEIGILLIKMNTAHFTLLNESQCQKKVLWLLTSFRWYV